MARFFRWVGWWYVAMNMTGKIGLVIVTGLILMAVFGPLVIPPERVTFQDLEHSFDPPSWQHPMGLDENGVTFWRGLSMARASRWLSVSRS